MNPRYACGLVVGKFAPLHRGHQYLIESALAACHDVVVLTYCNPEIPGFDPEVRARWIDELYPQTIGLVVTPEKLAAWFPGEARSMPSNDADDHTHRKFTAELLRRVAKREVDAVFTSESYGNGLAAYLSSYNHRWNRAAKSVVHVSVDPSRQAVPISGQTIRGNIHDAKKWLHPAVYASFVERVVCLGGESSGKSTLAQALATEFDTRYCAEFGREWWIERGGDLSMDDLVHIAQQQVKREEQLARHSNRYLFCDTSPLTTLFYALEHFGHADSRLEALAARRYSMTLLCAPDFPFVQDGTRREPEFRMHQHAWYKQELARRSIPYREVRGEVQARIQQVRRMLEVERTTIL